MDFISLAVIALVAVLAPIIVRLIPGKVVPETVILIFAGAVLGPYMLGIIEVDDVTSFLSELGLAFLFLLAGYEIDPKSLTGTQGKAGLAAWAISFVVGLGIMLAAAHYADIETMDAIAVAIALTTTAIGTLMPILKERKLMGTPVGESVLSFGTWGELAPIVAIALLLSARSAWKSTLVLLAFMFVAVLIGIFGARVKKHAGRIYTYLAEGADTLSQTTVRVVVLLLVTLLALAEVAKLDIVLGAFAAGFVLRYVMPQATESFEHKIEGIAYGFFIPLFFIVSGCKIDFAAVASYPLMMVGFIVMLLLVRGVPILAALAICKETKAMSRASRVSVSLYCVTALPLIVAVTSVTVKAGVMSPEIASVLVAAGAVTVLVMPFMAMMAMNVADMHPIQAVEEIAAAPAEARDVIADHWAMGRMLSKQDRDLVFRNGLYDEHVAEDMTHEDAHRLAQRHHAADAERVAKHFEEVRAQRLADIRRRHEAVSRLHEHHTEMARQMHEERVELARQLREEKKR